MTWEERFKNAISPSMYSVIENQKTLKLEEDNNGNPYEVSVILENNKTYFHLRLDDFKNYETTRYLKCTPGKDFDHILIDFNQLEIFYFELKLPTAFDKTSSKVFSEKEQDSKKWLEHILFCAYPRCENISFEEVFIRWKVSNKRMPSQRSISMYSPGHRPIEVVGNSVNKSIKYECKTLILNQLSTLTML